MSQPCADRGPYPVLTSAQCQSERDLFLDICDRLQNEGDRVYLGSSNDAETLRTMARRFWLEMLP